MSYCQTAGTFSEQEKLKLLQKILSHPQNRMCADCSANEPTWASLKFGVWVCLNCSGYHRNIGATHTRIQSAYLDQWPLHDLEIFTSLTNMVSNNYWEANLNTEIDRKPCPDHEAKQGLAFVKTKYVEKKFVAQNSKNPTEHYSDFKPIAIHCYDDKIQEGNLEARNKIMRFSKRIAFRTSLFEGMNIKVRKMGAQTEKHYPNNSKVYSRVEFDPYVTTTKTITYEIPQVLSLQEIPSEPLPCLQVQRILHARNNTVLTPGLHRNSSNQFYNLSISRDSFKAPHSLSPHTTSHEGSS